MWHKVECIAGSAPAGDHRNEVRNPFEWEEVFEVAPSLSPMGSLNAVANPQDPREGPADTFRLCNLGLNKPQVSFRNSVEIEALKAAVV